MDSTNILVISGGNRKDSFTTKVAHALPELAPSGMQLAVHDISSLPLYNQDLEADYPAEAQALKDAIEAADGIIIVTPEHNRSIPAALKNALDWASRPWGTNSWAGKPVLLAGVTPGGLGAAQALAHLRQIAVYLDMRVLGQPELYLSEISGKLGEDGSLEDEGTRELLTKALTTFAEFTRKLK